MAKENIAFLMGQIAAPPKFSKSNEETNIKAMMPLRIIKRFLPQPNTGIKKDVFSTPLIISGNPNIIKQIENFNAGDIIRLKGVFSTQNIRKSQLCSVCGTKNTTVGTRTFITPIYIECLEKRLSEENGFEYLYAHSQESNELYMIGTVCNPQGPIYYQNPSGSIRNCQYQIAVNRKIRIPEDGIHIRTDYPWVKSYGTQAEKDYKNLHSGSVLYLNAYLVTREIKRNQVCCKCHTPYKWMDSTVEIVPYFTRYLANYEEDSNLPQQEQNLVLLYGRLNATPHFKESCGITSLTVFPRTYAPFQHQAESSNVILFTGNPDIGVQFKEIKKGDIIEATGTLCSQQQKKKVTCTCGTTHEEKEMRCFIAPYNIKKRLAEQESITMEDLHNHLEISNQVFIIGTVSNHPLFIQDPKICSCKYQLIVHRNVRTRQGEVLRVDYLWVISYGHQAREDALRLVQGSIVYINGYLSTKSEKKESLCSTCRGTYQWTTTMTYIVPYSVEYCDHYLSDADFKSYLKS